MTTNNLNEFNLIARIKRWLNNKGLVVPIGDDAAAFDLDPSLTTLFTSDSLIENVHFIMPTVKAVDLGYKALTVNVSDIAAMGGVPLFATVALALPSSTDLIFIKQFYKGLNNSCLKYKVKIVGGDISAAKEFVVNISLIGQVAKDLILRRNKARAGDDILVTGSLGASASGLKLTLDSKIKDNSYLRKRHFQPEARLDQAKEAARLGVKTAIDISDGLASDCQRICEESGVGCTLIADKIPIDKKVLSFAAKNKISALQLAISGGEDYELIFTCPPRITKKLLEKFRQKDWPLTFVGKVNSSKKVEVIDKDGKQLEWKKGYEHKFN